MIKITIKYFGVIAEETGKTEEVLELDSDDVDVESLKDHCTSKYSLTDTNSIQVAVNQMMGASGPLEDGDEVAFLPPFSGG
jgi:molybdopterin converting factor subunit 1